MTRSIYNRFGKNICQKLLSISEGGTDASDKKTAANNLGYASFSSVDKPNGLVGLNSDNKIKSNLILDNISLSPSLDGSLFFQSNESSIFTITDYDTKTVYKCSANYGKVTQRNNEICYQAPSFNCVDIVKINNKTIIINISDNILYYPVIIYPINSAINLPTSILFLLANINSLNESDKHLSTTWQISLDISFSNIFKEIRDDDINKKSLFVNDLDSNTIYYIRAKYNIEGKEQNEWSKITSFTTKTEFSEFFLLSQKNNPSQYNSNLFARTLVCSENGNIIATGAHREPGKPINNFTTGTVFLYSCDKNDLRYDLELCENISNNFNYGFSISLSKDGTTIAVGSVGDLNKKGSVYLWKKNNGSWVKMFGPYMTQDDAYTQETYFGKSVSLSEDGLTLAVSSDVKTNNSTYSVINIYNYRNGSWTKSRRIYPNAMDKSYISKIALSDNGKELIFGRPESNNSEGELTIYKLINNEWVDDFKFIPLEVESFYNTHQKHINIGYNFSMSSNSEFILYSYQFTIQDKAYWGINLEKRTTTGWNLIRKFNPYFEHPEDIESYDGVDLGDTDLNAIFRYGNSLSVSNDGKTVVIGQHNNLTNKGAVRVHSVRSIDDWGSDEDVYLAEDGAEGSILRKDTCLSSDGKKLIIPTTFLNENGLLQLYTR